jgi:hypothetical protein
MRWTTAALSAAAGALAGILFDPQNGRRRRAEMIDRTAGTMRRGLRRARRAGRATTAEIEGRRRGMMHALAGRPARPVANEQNLADRVRSELFRDAAVPKGRININVEREGVVVLRGEVQRAETIGDVESRVRGIAGVRDVENLMHLTGTPARMRA